MTARDPFRVLFLCMGNAGRSIFAEALANRLGAPRFAAVSAGARPREAINPHALALLQREGLATEALRPKSWNDFAAPGAPQIDAVITLCDAVAAEACPVWSGAPLTAHWSTPDPTAAGDPETAFAEVYALLERRVAALCALAPDRLDQAALQGCVRA